MHGAGSSPSRGGSAAWLLCPSTERETHCTERALIALGTAGKCYENYVDTLSILTPVKIKTNCRSLFILTT